jgi:hypothetical protein
LWCQALDTALVAPVTRSTTPTSDGACGMTVEAVRYTRRLSPWLRSRRSSMQVDAGPRLLRTKRTRTANVVCTSDRQAARRTTPGGTVPTTSVPDGQGQRSIQVDGLRVPCVSLQTPGDQHRLVFRSWRQARAAPISSTVYVGHTEPRSGLSLELLGISHTQTGLESRPAALSQGTAGPRKRR